MECVYFKCDCGQSVAVDGVGVGSAVQCPNCGKMLVVPAPDIFWKCVCGEEMAALKSLSGTSVQCVACGAENTVPVRLELKHKPAQSQQLPLPFDAPRVPVGRNDDIRCPKCGYLAPSILERCPQCGHNLHKDAVMRRRCIMAAEFIFVVGLGWFLAAHYARITAFLKSLVRFLPE